MLRVFLALILVLMIVSGCKEKVTVANDPVIYAGDLIGAWDGTLPGYHVFNGQEAESYTLQDLRCSLILTEQTYWFELGSYSDDLDYSFVSKGYWLFLEAVPHEIYFQVREDWSSQVFKVRNAADSIVVDNTINKHSGDGSAMISEWQCVIELGDGELRLYDFLGFTELGEEIILELK
jgi:hypothetical protein